MVFYWKFLWLKCRVDLASIQRISSMKEIPVLIFHTKDYLSLRSVEISLDLDKLVHSRKTLKIKLKLQITKENSMVSFIQALFVFWLNKKYCQLFCKWVTILKSYCLCISFRQRLKMGERLRKEQTLVMTCHRRHKSIIQLLNDFDEADELKKIKHIVNLSIGAYSIFCIFILISK